jgi:protein subunit release factor A
MFLEIRAHEGGDDAKLFMNDLAKTYMKFLEKSG